MDPCIPYNGIFNKYLLKDPSHKDCSIFGYLLGPRTSHSQNSLKADIYGMNIGDTYKGLLRGILGV